MTITSESLADFGVRNITAYATEVNLDRAVPELYDGLKPVFRRVAWSAHAFNPKEAVKSAKIVGHCIGSYSPHSDVGTYGAMVTMVNSNVPLIEGIGNWGSLLDPPAAMRYSNAKLSKVGLSVMDPDYLAVTSMVPNYDDTTTEPVVLPAKLPFLILNGAEGIGVGITCSIPTFTVESVVDVLTRLLSGEQLQVTDLARLLKPKQYYGGRLVNSESNKAQWLQLMKTGQASVEFESPLEVDEAKKQITVGEWPNGLNPEKFVQKVRAMPETQRCYNSKGSTTFVI